jgi:hypothetical protein
MYAHSLHMCISKLAYQRVCISYRACGIQSCSRVPLHVFIVVNGHMRIHEGLNMHMHGHGHTWCVTIRILHKCTQTWKRKMVCKHEMDHCLGKPHDKNHTHDKKMSRTVTRKKERMEIVIRLITQTMSNMFLSFWRQDLLPMWRQASVRPAS